MSCSLAKYPPPFAASQDLLQERLANLEATLVQARGQVLCSFDRELASLRGWMDSLQHFDPTVGLQTFQEPAFAPLEPTFEELISEPPCPVPCNVVPFRVPSADDEIAITEQPLDPALANAT